MARVVFDTTFLARLWRSDLPAPIDLETGEPVTRVRDRLDFFIAELERTGSKIIVPTPALSELLAGLKEPGRIVLDDLNSSSVFEIRPFGLRAAIEAAASVQVSRTMGTLKGLSSSTWQKVKVDRQIVAIATVERAERICSEDSDVKNLAEIAGIAFLRLADLSLPPEEPQRELFSRDAQES